MERKIPIHDHDGYIVPLLWTFAFSHNEYWCPCCGENYPMFHDEEEIEETPILKERREQYRKQTKNYLAAVGMIKGKARKKWGGQMKSFAEYSKSTQRKWKRWIKEWQPGVTL